MKTFPRLSLLLGLILSLATVAAAQEKSVRPGINDSYEKRNIEQSVKTFEGESREIFRRQ